MSRRSNKRASGPGPSSSTFIRKSEIEGDDHLIKKGLRLSPTLDGIMVGKLAAWKSARTTSEKKRILQLVVDQMPGRFLKETRQGTYVIVEGRELEEKLSTRFRNLNKRVRDKPHRYTSATKGRRPARIVASNTSIYRGNSTVTKEDDDDDDDEDMSSTGSEDSAESHNDECEVCDRPGKLLCCGTCTLVFHLGCHRPALKGAPKGKAR